MTFHIRGRMRSARHTRGTALTELEPLPTDPTDLRQRLPIFYSHLAVLPRLHLQWQRCRRVRRRTDDAQGCRSSVSGALLVRWLHILRERGCQYPHECLAEGEVGLCTGQWMARLREAARWPPPCFIRNAQCRVPTDLCSEGGRPDPIPPEMAGRPCRRSLRHRTAAHAHVLWAQAHATTDGTSPAIGQGRGVCPCQQPCCACTSCKATPRPPSPRPRPFCPGCALSTLHYTCVFWCESIWYHFCVRITGHIVRPHCFDVDCQVVFWPDAPHSTSRWWWEDHRSLVQFSILCRGRCAANSFSRRIGW